MTKNKKNNSDFKGSDIEIIPSDQSNQTIDLSNQNNVEPIDDNAVSISRDRVQVKKSGNLVIGNLNLMLNPLKKRWQQHYSRNIWHLIADIFLVFIIITLIFFLYLINNRDGSKIISLSIKNNIETSAGSYNSFELDYKSNSEISGVTAQVIFPENFIIESVSPGNLYDDNTKTFNLGNLEKNSFGKIKINGFVWGEVNDQQNIFFKFNCSKCGKNGINNSLYYNIEKPAISNSLQVEDNVFLDSEFKGTLNIVNNTNQKLENIRVTLGSDVEIKKSNLSLENGEIIINQISSGEELNLEFEALCKRGENISIIPSFNFNLFDNNLNFTGVEKVISVKKPGLNISIISEDELINQDLLASYKINYNNKEKVTIKNIKLTILSANPNFSVESLKIDDNLKGVSLVGNTIIINDLLENEFSSIPFKVIFDRRQNNPNQELSLKINLQYDLDGQTIKYTSYSNKSKIASKATASALAYYYSPQGDQLGVGPLPPSVNMATNYWIFLEVSSIGNDLENFVLTADLPENIYFSDNKRVLDGKLLYGEVSKRMTWEIEKLSGDSSRYRANFEITLIPEESDLGKVPILLNNIKFTAKDSFTDQELKQNLANINANIKNDKFSSDKGQVVDIR